MKQDANSGAVQIITSSRLQQFLSKHRTERGKKYNFTSYSKPLGSYHVPDEKLDDFYDLYVDLVTRHNVMPYLTEKPGQYSPIVIDIDLKFPLPSDAQATLVRKYTPDFVRSIVSAYNEFLNKWLVLDDNQARCYLFERPSPYKSDKNLKDGFHLSYPYLTCPPALKLMARDFVLRKCEEELQSLNTENDLNDILDLAVIQRNNWFVYGSGKPGCAPYRLSHVYDSSLNIVEDSMPFKDLVRLLSVKGTTAANFKFCEGMEEEFADAYEEYQDRAAGRERSAGVPKREGSQTNLKSSRHNKFDACENLDFVRELIKIIDPARADAYGTWIEVGWCLHNISKDNLLVEWIEFSRQSAKFEEGACEKAWDGMREEGLSMGSLVRWAKEDNDEAYKVIRSQDNQTLLEAAAASNGAHHAVARVLYGMYRYQYVCLSRKFKAWIEFKGHKWHRTEDGYGLLCKLSNDLVSRVHQHVTEVF